MKRILFPLAIVALASVGYLGCTRKEATSAFRKDAAKDNIVIIAVDALRADHLPFYGYPKDTAPFLSELAAKSVVFERAFAPASATAPSTASLFSSLYPSQHGVITGKAAHRNLSKNHPDLQLNRIPEGLDLTAELLKGAGYKTYLLSDNLQICSEMGFAQGFDRFEAHRHQDAEGMNAMLSTWAPELTAGGKYFLYLHYMDPHKPYTQRKPWYEEGATKRERMINAYDSEIRYFDEHIRAMFELYRWRENALIIIIADHGEAFGEHGTLGHGINLFREVIHVPLVVYHRDLAPGRIKENVSTVDILPTLAALTNVPALPAWRGISLVPALEGATINSDRRIVSQLLRPTEYKRAAEQSVVSGHWHYLHTQPHRGKERHRLYSLSSDPKEKKDISADHPEKLTAFKETLDGLNAEASKTTKEQVTIPLDDETLKELKTLGYVN